VTAHTRKLGPPIPLPIKPMTYRLEDSLGPSQQSNTLLMALATRQAVPPYGSCFRMIFRARPLGLGSAFHLSPFYLLLSPPFPSLPLSKDHRVECLEYHLCIEA
jgi:hypothetical protein